jgi:hypothetical protein
VCVTEGNSYPVGPSREHDIWSHLNLAIRLLVYARAFPEVIVPMEVPASKAKEKRIRSRKMLTHPRIRKDAATVKFITYRKGYEKRAHTKTLRAARFKRNADGTPRVVAVRKSRWIPPVGYIGGRKMTVKELEEETLRDLQAEEPVRERLQV